VAVGHTDLTQIVSYDRFLNTDPGGEEKKYFPFQNCDSCGALIVIKTVFPIFWGHVSVLDADLICLNELAKANAGEGFSLFSTRTTYVTRGVVTHDGRIGIL
jgi:hypothetical protein